MVEIVRTLQDRVPNSDFVAIGNLLVGTESRHSAFVIQFQNELLEFHYTGSAIEFNCLQNDYFHVVTSTIPDYEVPSFVAMCKNVLKRANPKYGFFYSGESYHPDGSHLSNVDLGERMTCAGFCLNVLKGFLEEDYLAYSDWNHTNHVTHPTNSNYLQEFCARHNLDISKMREMQRRIEPRECLVSCLFDALPIRKADIDSKMPEAQRHFESRLGKKP